MTCSESGIVEENLDYDKTSSLNAVQLIREIKKHQLLYNNQVEGYNDNSAKELAWKQIYEAMFPRYRYLPTATQTVIKQTVRRRWKTLRNTMARDVKARITNKNYQKNPNPLLPEMQFLLPFIRSVYAKVVQRREVSPGSRQRHFAEENTMFNEMANATFMDSDDLIDLTSEEKPHLVNNVEPDSTPNNAYQEPVSTSMNENQLIGDGGGDGVTVSYPSSFCVTECIEDPHQEQQQFTSTPTIEYRGSDVERITSSPLQTHLSANILEENTMITATTTTTTSTSTGTANFAPNKRKRSSADDIQFQEKLLEIFANTMNRSKDLKSDREPEDEDRMFMLSLVSDLRGLPTAKRMLVKAEIVTAIARAAQ